MSNNTTCFLLELCFEISDSDINVKRHSATSRNVVFSALIAVAILSPVAVVGNALVLAAIWRNPSLRTPSYILLAGLALSDFCTGLITQPFHVANELSFFLEPDMNFFDKSSLPRTYLTTRAIGVGCFEYLVNITILIITSMSIERWLHMTRRSLANVRRVCFIVAVLILLPIPLVVHRLNDISNFSFEYFVANFLLFLFCFTVTSIAYFKVFRIIRRHQQQIRTNELPQNFAQPAINFEKYKKSVFSILYIVAVFYVSYFPIVIHLGRMIFFPENIVSNIKLSFHVTAVFLFMASSLNPILYLWRMKDIRNEVRQLVKRILRQGN